MAAGLLSGRDVDVNERVVQMLYTGRAVTKG